MTDQDKERRLRWANERLDCDPVTGAQGYEEIILPDDLVSAMEILRMFRREVDEDVPF